MLVKDIVDNGDSLTVRSNDHEFYRFQKGTEISWGVPSGDRLLAQVSSYRVTSMNVHGRGFNVERNKRAIVYSCMEFEVPNIPQKKRLSLKEVEILLGFEIELV